MQIIWFREVARGGLDLREKVEGDDSLYFLVQTDTPYGPKDQVARDPRCPKVYDPHPVSGLLVCVNVRVDYHNETQFLVEARYSTKYEEPEEETNPLSRPAEVNISTSTQGTLTVLDGNRDPMMTTAGELFAPIEDVEPFTVLSVQKNVPPMIPPWIDQYVGSVNADSIRIANRTWPKHTLRIMSLSMPFPPRVENKVHYVPLSLEIHHRYDGWWFERLNKGWYEAEKELVEINNYVRERYVLKRIRVSNTDGYSPEEVFLDPEGKAFREVQLDRNGEVVLDAEGNPKKSDRLRAKLEPHEIIVRKFPKGRRLPFATLSSVLR